MKTHSRESGRKIFQPNLINWSYLNLGKVALTQRKTNNRNPTLAKNHIYPGIIYNIFISNIGNHPPKNKIVPRELIKIIAEYSPKRTSQIT